MFDALREQRFALAKEQGVPAYVVFPDRSLMEMARARPTDPGALSQIHGVGAAKLERYGDIFLHLIRGHERPAPANDGELTYERDGDQA